MSFVRREGPIILTGVIAIILILREFISFAPLNSAGGLIVRFATLLGAFTTGIATIALVRYHYRHVTRRTSEQWYLSALLIIVLVFFTVTGIMKVPWYNLMYVTLIGRPFGANWGIMTFFLISASYRAFRVGTLEAYAALLGWAVVLLSLAPLGGFLFGTSISSLGTFIVNVVAAGSFRGFVVAAALGTIIFGLRVILGMERGAFGGESG